MGFLKALAFGKLPRIFLTALLVIFAFFSFVVFVLSSVSTAKVKDCDEPWYEHVTVRFRDYDDDDDDYRRVTRNNETCDYFAWIPYLLLAAASFLASLAVFSVLVYIFLLPRDAGRFVPRYIFHVMAFIILISLPAFFLGWKYEGPWTYHLEPEASLTVKVTLVFAHVYLFLAVLTALAALVLDFPLRTGPRGDGNMSRNPSTISAHPGITA
ncbi:hypothetical protein AK830_g558 [Neonectria ditissima]|uniref:Uncharacterized protein n=1 Tax=Neonectria ditissima TaxID=78410 RepID=A0A0P7C1Z9_9HYPO|nr:hypothetical protein AK830_g558 [Neonectria ditissima]